MPIPTLTAEAAISDALRSWTRAEDGWFYPAEPQRSLVRVQITEGVYTIQRRRTLTTPWTLLVRALVADFDVGAFHTWQRQWVMYV